MKLYYKPVYWCKYCEKEFEGELIAFQNEPDAIRVASSMMGSTALHHYCHGMDFGVGEFIGFEFIREEHEE